MAQIGVDTTGAVQLGNSVVADGYRRHAEIRVQTHIHQDHMGRFSASKGFHDVILHKASRALLELEGHPDLSLRENVYALDYGTWEHPSGLHLDLVDAGHMLGSSQVAIEYPDGDRVGYSGDISWPLSKVIKVDKLVVDASYGSESSIRRFPRQEAEDSFLQLASDRLHKGSLIVKAHRGTLHRAAQLLTANLNYPIVVSPQVELELDVFRQFGIPIGDCITTVPAGSRYIRLMGHRQAVDQYIEDIQSTIQLTGFRTRKEPVKVLSEDRTYAVCLSDHADFDETLQYVEATGAKEVVVDNSRAGNGAELAIAIAERLNLPASFELDDDEPY